MAARTLTVLLAAGAALAAPSLQGRDTTCTNPKQRRPWHTLTGDEKTAYLNAELCLMQKNATLGLRGTKTRFDELQSCHVLQAEITHFVGAFLPFHRLLMWAHEHLLQTECGYEGAQPYWYEQADAGAFSTASIFDPDIGFGGDGTGEGNCIEDGPFAGYMNNLGPGYDLNEHCVDRRISDRTSLGSTQDEIDACHAKDNWIDAWNCIEKAPHNGGHGGVGGEMSNPISSPGDPIFYLHHTFLDKVWWDWQALDLDTRLTEMGGQNRAQSNRLSARPDDVPEPEIVGDPGDETTLDHVINMYGVVDSKTIREVMDIGGELCYEYVEA